MISRRDLLLSAAAAMPRERRNVVVYQEAGRYGGWPANHGLWAWGKEAVAGESARKSGVWWHDGR